MKHSVKVIIEKNDEVFGGYEMISADEPNNNLLAELMLMHVEMFKKQLIDLGHGVDIDRAGMNSMIKQAMFNGFNHINKGKPNLKLIKRDDNETK